MSILRRERSIDNYEQLAAYVQLGQGAVKGTYYGPVDQDDGKQQEVETIGFYVRTRDDEGESTIIFASGAGVQPRINFEVPTDESFFALGVAKVRSRKKVA